MYILVFAELYYLIIIYHIPSKQISNLPTNIIIYLALYNGYFHFLNMGETARRIRILMELMISKDGLSLDEIFNHYNAQEIINRRLDRLIETKQIIKRDNKYYINNSTMLFIAKSIDMLKLILLGRKSEI